jgi:plasmid stability protein
MRQMITRVDEELHARLKERAAAEGRSINELVVQALTAALDDAGGKRAVRERARATGRLVVPEPPAETPHDQKVVAAGRELGDAVSAALGEERSGR